MGDPATQEWPEPDTAEWREMSFGSFDLRSAQLRSAEAERDELTRLLLEAREEVGKLETRLAHAKGSDSCAWRGLAEQLMQEVEQLRDIKEKPMEQHIEKLSAAVHDRWMQTKREQGVESRRSESGEELMVPYDQLSEQAKDLDRGSVRAVLDAAADCGLKLTEG